MTFKKSINSYIPLLIVLILLIQFLLSNTTNSTFFHIAIISFLIAITLSISYIIEEDTLIKYTAISVIIAFLYSIFAQIQIS